MKKLPDLSCPFCTGKLTFETDGPDPAVLHTLPPCKVYLETEDALAFVKACNEEIEARYRQARDNS